MKGIKRDIESYIKIIKLLMFLFMGILYGFVKIKSLISNSFKDFDVLFWFMANYKIFNGEKKFHPIIMKTSDIVEGQRKPSKLVPGTSGIYTNLHV